MMKKILLPVDGSNSSSKTYEYAKDICEKHDGQLVLLYVKENNPWNYGNIIPYFDGNTVLMQEYIGEDEGTEDRGFKEKYTKDKNEIKEHDFKDVDIHNFDKVIESYSKKVSTKILEDAAKYFRENGLEVETRLETGDPASKIMNIAESEDFDLIIMCTHGMSAIRRFTLGSVTNKVVHHANIPVLVLRSNDE